MFEWMYQVSLKRLYLSTKLYGLTSQKTAILIEQSPYHVARTILQAIHCYDSDGMLEEHYECTSGWACDRAY
jgi:hypothetical protein